MVTLKIMKTKIILFFLITVNFTNFQSQNIQKIVALSDGSNFSTIEIYTDQYIFVLNGGGIISSIANANLNGNLDYYDNEYFEKDKYGKLKSVGDVQVEYWSISDEDDPRYGKVKSIGNIGINYWESRNYEEEKFGKVKSIGAIPIDYWEKDSFTKDRSGKIKSIGKIFIDYYENSSINKGKNGKIKNFGPVQFDYWDNSFTDNGKAGKLKSITGNSEKILVKFNIFYDNMKERYQNY